MDFVAQLKSQIDIVKVVGDYVRLRRVGATGRYVGLCPFHQEKTPSFGVNQTQQFYKCFGCGAGGDALKFVMEIEGMTFPEALKLLAERNGIPIPQRNEYSDAESKLRAALHHMHEIASSLFQEALRNPAAERARGYLKQRGLTPEAIEMFGLGFSDPSGQGLTRKLIGEKFTEAQLEASGLVRRRDSGGYYDAFRGRLMFPIHNESGKVIGFGARALSDDDQPKYLNSPETPIYKKNTTLYNLHRARDGMRKSGRALLVEGYMDVIGAWNADVREVVASCGTALTNAQVRAIRRHADTAVVNFDPDTAGANAAERAIQVLLDEGLHVKVVSLDSGPGSEPGVKLDPDEYVKRNGADAYRDRVDTALGYFHWLADRARGKFDMRSADGRMDAFKFLLPSVQKIGDKLERAAIANDIAGYLGVEPSLVLDQFKRSAAERRTPSPSAKKPDVILPATERILVSSLLRSEDVRRSILPLLSGTLIEGLSAREILESMGLIGADRSTAVLFAELEARLGDSARALLHEIANADELEEEDETETMRQAEACVRRLQNDLRKRQVDEMRSRVKVAEREGRMEEALAWLQQLQKLETDVANSRAVN